MRPAPASVAGQINSPFAGFPSGATPSGRPFGSGAMLPPMRTKLTEPPRSASMPAVEMTGGQLDALAAAAAAQRSRHSSGRGGSGIDEESLSRRVSSIVAMLKEAGRPGGSASDEWRSDRPPPPMWPSSTGSSGFGGGGNYSSQHSALGYYGEGGPSSGVDDGATTGVDDGAMTGVDDGATTAGDAPSSGRSHLRSAPPSGGRAWIMPNRSPSESVSRSMNGGRPKRTASLSTLAEHRPRPSVAPRREASVYSSMLDSSDYVSAQFAALDWGSVQGRSPEIDPPTPRMGSARSDGGLLPVLQPLSRLGSPAALPLTPARHSGTSARVSTGSAWGQDGGSTGSISGDIGDSFSRRSSATAALFLPSRLSSRGRFLDALPPPSSDTHQQPWVKQSRHSASTAAPTRRAALLASGGAIIGSHYSERASSSSALQLLPSPRAAERVTWSGPAGRGASTAGVTAAAAAAAALDDGAAGRTAEPTRDSKPSAVRRSLSRSGSVKPLPTGTSSADAGTRLPAPEAAGLDGDFGDSVVDVSRAEWADDGCAHRAHPSYQHRRSM